MQDNRDAVTARPGIDRGSVLSPAAEFPHGWSQRFWTQLWRLTGWRVVGRFPPQDKFVIIVAPHTSNWDMPLGLLAGWSSGILKRWPYGFMMKDSMFRGFLGPIMRRLGGLAVDRSSPHDVVTQMAEILKQRDELVLAITPEGTRRFRDHWKSGFYFIALKAEVPIVPVYFDYRLKEIGVGNPYFATGDAEVDLGYFREFYRGIEGRRPANVGTIRFRNTAESGQTPYGRPA